ncbi:hypothetical protein ACIOML_23555 [Streptomyces anulatus]
MPSAAQLARHRPWVAEVLPETAAPNGADAGPARRSAVADPERVGDLLRSALSGHELAQGDYQDYPPWRQVTTTLVTSLAAYTGGPVIVPMTVLDPHHATESILAEPSARKPSCCRQRQPSTRPRRQHRPSSGGADAAPDRARSPVRSSIHVTRRKSCTGLSGFHASGRIGRH